MAERRPLVLVSGVLQELPTGDTLPGAGPGGSGDVVGPASSTNGALALFDGTTGKLLKQAGSNLAVYDDATGSGVTAARVTDDGFGSTFRASSANAAQTVTYTFEGYSYTDSAGVYCRNNESGSNVSLYVQNENAFLGWTSLNGFLRLGTTTAGFGIDITEGGDIRFNGARTFSGDFSNATLANRFKFQTATVNGESTLTAVPNGTSTVAGFRAYNTPVATNGSYVEIATGAAATYLRSSESGTGAMLPLVVQVGTSDVATFTEAGSLQLHSSMTEAIFLVTGTAPALDPAFGTIQTWSLTGNSTPTEGVNWIDGQAMTLMIADGASAFTVNWSGMGITWVGGTAPALPTSGYAVIELWKVAGTIYGADVGDVA